MPGPIGLPLVFLPSSCPPAGPLGAASPSLALLDMYHLFKSQPLRLSTTLKSPPSLSYPPVGPLGAASPSLALLDLSPAGAFAPAGSSLRLTITYTASVLSSMQGHGLYQVRSVASYWGRHPFIYTVCKRACRTYTCSALSSMQGHGFYQVGSICLAVLVMVSAAVVSLLTMLIDKSSLAYDRPFPSPMHVPHLPPTPPAMKQHAVITAAGPFHFLSSTLPQSALLFARQVLPRTCIAHTWGQ